MPPHTITNIQHNNKKYMGSKIHDAPHSSIVFVIHDDSDAVFAGGREQWLQCIFVSTIRQTNSLKAVSMEKTARASLTVKLKHCQSCRGLRILKVPKLKEIKKHVL